MRSAAILSPHSICSIVVAWFRASLLYVQVHLLRPGIISVSSHIRYSGRSLIGVTCVFEKFPKLASSIVLP